MRRRQLICTLILTVLSHGPIYAEVLPAKELLQAYDEEFLSALSLEIDAVYPTSSVDPSQGSISSRAVITSDGLQQALSLQSKTGFTPRYNANRTRGDYDTNENYIVGYHKADFVFLGADGWRTRTDFEHLTIDKGDNILRVGKPTSVIAAHPVNHADPANLMFRYVLPLGRGFSQLIDQVVNVEESANGIAKVVARGTLFSPNQGEWTLEVDTNLDWLVRSARFTQDGSSSSSTVLADSSAGTVGEVVPVAARGSFTLTPRYVITVSVKDYSRNPNLVVLGSVSEAVNTVAERTTLMDFGRVDERGTPFIMRGTSLIE